MTDCYRPRRGVARGAVVVVASALAGGFRVVRVERRLYGGSGPARSPHAMAREVEDVEAVLARLGEPALLVGHSSGGIVALETALRRPATLAALAVYEPPVALDAPLGGAALTRARAAIARGRPGKAMAIHLVDVVEMPWLTVMLLRLTPAWKTLKGWAAAQIPDDEAIASLGVGIHCYARIALPTLLLGGGRSPAPLRRALVSLARLIPAALHRLRCLTRGTSPTCRAWRGGGATVGLRQRMLDASESTWAAEQRPEPHKKNAVR